MVLKNLLFVIIAKKKDTRLKTALNPKLREDLTVEEMTEIDTDQEIEEMIEDTNPEEETEEEEKPAILVEKKVILP